MLRHINNEHSLLETLDSCGCASPLSKINAHVWEIFLFVNKLRENHWSKLNSQTKQISFGGLKIQISLCRIQKDINKNIVTGLVNHLGAFEVTKVLTQSIFALTWNNG